MRKRNRPEDELQRAVFQHIRARGKKGLVAFHVPNGGQRSKTEAAILSGLGVLPGVLDIILLYAGIFHALELKDEGRALTTAQMDFIIAVKSAGGKAAWADNLNSAIMILESWDLLRGKTQTSLQRLTDLSF